ncbi:hypothetical protein MTP09_05705 [Chryseobacterium suipulveris]|uniref:Mechanosensitive ion channel protein MscS n=1 Tax=Chryseobacterium suipulveris TaxID=2929800 RepID=A0ABY4C047_9FLAO|nr:hypothetical protein [Chryseobacterium suipulveris]UOE42130.1 hypothetical protein MTP09_05705 [Chryseobacterium suipulveris]
MKEIEFGFREFLNYKLFSIGKENIEVSSIIFLIIFVIILNLVIKLIRKLIYRSQNWTTARSSPFSV